jgi:membrane-associated phospholipid phosphatase
MSCRRGRTGRHLIGAGRLAAIGLIERAPQSGLHMTTDASVTPADTPAPDLSQAVEAAQRVAEEQTLPTRIALLRGQGGMVVAIVGLVGFIGIFALVKAKRSQEIDVAITIRLQARQHRSLGVLMEAVSWLGFPPQSRTIPPLLMAGMWLLRFRVEAAFQLLAWGTGGLSSVLKGIMRRPRPLPEQVRVVIAPLGGSSFPSGHVITYVGTYGFLAYLAHSHLRSARVRRPLVGGLLGMLALVGPSRIYQGHHWPTDVAASYLLGISYFIVLTAFYRRARARWPRSNRGRLQAWLR